MASSSRRNTRNETHARKNNSKMKVGKVNIESDMFEIGGFESNIKKSSLQTPNDINRDVWSNRIIETYEIIKQEYDEKVHVRGTSFLNKATTEYSCPIIAGNLQPKKLVILHESNVERNVHKSMYRICPHFSPPSAMFTPPILRAYQSSNCPILSEFPQCNIGPELKGTFRCLCVKGMQCTKAEDERALKNIPFMDDDMDETFGQELLRVYDGVHGAGLDTNYEFINDKLLFLLIHALERQYKDDDGYDFHRVTDGIARLFPNKLPAKRIRSIWPDLLARYAGIRDNKSVLPNIDGPNAVAVSADRALHSYRTLFCRRCYVYDCLLHGISESLPPPKRRRKIDHSSKSPCSSDCYRIELLPMGQKLNNVVPISNSNGSSPRLPNVSGSQFESLSINVDSWSPMEETMFNVLRRPFCDDFCQVADSLSHVCPQNPKTCRQVYSYARRQCDPSPRVDSAITPMKKRSRKATKDQHRTFRAVKWTAENPHLAVQNQHVYQPCHHPGQPCCKESDCSCVSVDNLCTKFCRCSDTCRYRFPGCRCALGGCRTNQCQCYYASWECDPDICKSCGADTVENETSLCHNVNIQRGLQKQLLLAPSDVAGWGCFAGQQVDKNDFISEYCGEVISQDECERRGHIYDKQKCSYLFGLNNEYAVDATRKGNLIRFANHSKKPNCRAKVLMVNGDHRIGIFSNRTISQGEELFFDYSYNKAQQVEFVSKELVRKKQPIGE